MQRRRGRQLAGALHAQHTCLRQLEEGVLRRAEGVLPHGAAGRRRRREGELQGVGEAVVHAHAHAVRRRGRCHAEG